MEFNFHDTGTLSKVRETISELLGRLSEAIDCIMSTPAKDIDDVFKRFILESDAYRKTPQYELLKAYETNCARECYFSNFNFEFFNIIKNSNRTVNEFVSAINTIKAVTSQLYHEASYISDNYL